MKKVTNKILIITACIIITFMIVSTFILVRKINYKTSYNCLPQQTANDTSSYENIAMEYKNGAFEVNKERVKNWKSDTIGVNFDSDTTIEAKK